MTLLISSGLFRPILSAKVERTKYSLSFQGHGFRPGAFRPISLSDEINRNDFAYLISSVTSPPKGGDFLSDEIPRGVPR